MDDNKKEEVVKKDRYFAFDIADKKNRRILESEKKIKPNELLNEITESDEY